MNKIEHLLLCVAEEGGEITQAAGKAGRFGLSDSPPNGGLPNNEYLVREVNDLLGVLELLQEHGVPLPGIGDREMIEAKKAKVTHFMTYATQRGTLMDQQSQCPAVCKEYCASERGKLCGK